MSRTIAAVFCGLIIIISLLQCASAQNATLPVWRDLRNALIDIVKQNNSGFGNNVWAVTVNNFGEIDQVVYSGAKVSDQWFASRTIAAMKAFTAFSLSSDSFAISTANVYGLSQPNGTLFGIQSTAPLDTQAAYKGCRERFGTERDPLRGQMIGGITVIAGGLALYDANGTLIGGVGVSGDTACTDHIIAWKLRHKLQFDYVTNGFGGSNSSSTNSSNGGPGQTETTQCTVLGNLTDANSVDLQCSAVNFTFFNCEVTKTSSSSSSTSSSSENNTLEINCPTQTSSDVTLAEQPIIVESSNSDSVSVQVSRSSSSASVLPSNTNSGESDRGQFDNLVHGAGSCALCYPVCDQAAVDLISRLLSEVPVSFR